MGLFYRFLTAICLCLVSGLLFADTIWIKNGDIISGEIKLIDSNKLIIQTKYAGEITIKSTDVKTFNVQHPSILKTDLYADKYYINAILPSEQSGAILIVDENGEEQTISITNNLLLIRDKPDSLLNDFRFNGQIRGGFFYDKGTKKTEKYLLDTNFVVRHNLWRHDASSSIRRSYKNNNVDTYFYGFQYNLDKFITSNLFWQSTTQYRHDWIEDIRSKQSIGTGPGYQLWNNEQSSFALALLLNYQKMGYRDNHTSHHPLGSVRWSYQRFFNGKSIRLFTNGSIGRTINDEVTLDFSASAGISYKVTDWFSLNTSLNKEKDKTRDGDSRNINYNMGFGFIW